MLWLILLLMNSIGGCFYRKWCKLYFNVRLGACILEIIHYFHTSRMPQDTSLEAVLCMLNSKINTEINCYIEVCRGSILLNAMKAVKRSTFQVSGVLKVIVGFCCHGLFSLIILSIG